MVQKPETQPNEINQYFRMMLYPLHPLGPFQSLSQALGLSMPVRMSSASSQRKVLVLGGLHSEELEDLGEKNLLFEW